MNTIKIVLKWIPSILVMGFIFYLSSIPGNVLDDAGLKNETVHVFGHAFMFLCLYLSYFFALKSHRISFLLVVLFAVSDELHQSFIPLRSASLFDILVDIIGGTTASFLIWLYTTYLQPKNSLN